MLNRYARAFFTKVFTPVARLFLALGISPDVVTIVGTLGVCFGALAFYPRHEFFIGTLVITAFVFSDTVDGVMARMSGRSGKWGAYLDSTLDRMGDAAIFGGLVLWYAGGGDDNLMAALALACLILGSVVSYAKARAEGLGMTANVGIAERADRLVATLVTTGLVGLGLPEIVLATVLALLALASLITVIQRMWAVRVQALAELAGRAGDLLTVAGFRLGWAVVRALPEGAAYGLFDRVADVTVRRGGTGVRRLRANYARVRPDLDDVELDALVRRGMRAYLRYYCEAFRLPAMSAADVDAKVTVAGEGPVRAVLAGGGPVVCFLGHLGNWDLAGAWCCRALGRVVTVAERLEPEAVFAEFLDFRTMLGMTILPLTGGGDVFAGLRREAVGPVVVPLLADRDLTGGGVEVVFCGQPARMAIGPAALALAVGAPLFPVTIRHTRRGRGWGIDIRFHDPVAVPAEGTTRERAHTMTQRCADALGAVVADDPSDWHMLQRVFVDDLDPVRGLGEDR